MGDFEAVTPVAVESPLEYHPRFVDNLTLCLEPGQWTVSGG